MKNKLFVEAYQQILETDQWVAGVHPKKGKMHQLLGIPDDKEISDVYSSGKSLAQALIKATSDKGKAAHMLAFAANVSSRHDIFDDALSAIKDLEN